MAKEKWFKLIEKEFSQIDQEWQWTYLLLIPITFNEQTIHKITITDHWKEKHSDIINNEKILELVRKLNGEIMRPEPKKKPNWPEVFVPRGIEHQGRKYRLIFWFKDHTTNHVWIRNCHPQD